MAFFLVRHAKAGSRDAWKGDDRQRPLSKPGWRQAEALVDLLAPYPITRILSSPYLRCLQTVQPLAKRRRLKVETANELGEGNGPGPVFRLLASLKGFDTMLCSHGDVVQEVLERLVEEGFLGGSQASDLDKGSTWVIEERGGKVLGARYVPPP